MQAAGERIGPAVAAVAACLCALFFGGGLSDAPLVWIGAIALLAGAVLLFYAAPPGPAALAYLGCLWALALWCGLSLVWSVSPDGSWTYTNRTLVYAAFALVGVVVGQRLAPDAVAAAATAVAATVIGWALLAKCIPALYSDYGRIARLRAPVDEWNMLALVCVAGVPLALWVAARRRALGAVLLYLFAVALLLTYSRFGVALSCACALAWLVLERDRVEALATVAVGGGVAVAVFAVALHLDGITSDAQPRSIRAHDGWVFALVLLGGAAAAAGGGALVARLRIAPHRRRAVERAATLTALVLALAALGVSIAKARTIWDDFTNPVTGQVSNDPHRFGHVGSGNRWAWWQEAWAGFTKHPLGGTGAGTFRFTDLRYRQSSDVTAFEPHNTPLQFLSETGAVGFLLLAGAFGVALARARGPLGIAFAAYVAHSVVNYDWSFLAVSGPFLLLGGVLVAHRRERATVRRPLLAAGAVLFALACLYSLAAPWLAQRAEASAATPAELNAAHSYDPLNTQIITERAASETGRTAERSYRDALALEPTNAEVWFELAQFYADNGLWTPAYRALSKAYRYDPYGPAGQCGVAAEIRRKVGVRSSCRGGG